jgi:GTP-binding protein EngB required for normal cell division
MNLPPCRRLALIKSLPFVTMAAEALEVQGSKGSTDRVLTIELARPKQDHLTLIDLPGLFSYTKSDSAAHSPTIVRGLVEKYIKQSNTIVLAVVSARTDYATQEILKIRKKLDPHGLRTIGVITGLDTVEPGTKREEEYLSLAMNEEMRLIRGWHALRNPAFKERQDPNCDRRMLEVAFFANVAPWNSLNPSTCGALALRTKLSEQLISLVGEHMDGVVDSLSTSIIQASSTLSKLGLERTTMREKRVWLYDIGAKYRHIVAMGLTGPYEGELFKTPSNRLRAQMRSECDSFALEMKSNGQTWGLRTLPRSGDVIADLANKATRIGDTRTSKTTQVISTTSYLQNVQAAQQESRALQLDDMPDPAFVKVLFNDQSTGWENLAEAFVHRIVVLLGDFLWSVIRHIIDARRAQLLFTQYLQPALDARKMLMETRLVELLKPYRKQHPFTSFHSFGKHSFFHRGRPTDEQELRHFQVEEDKVRHRYPAAFAAMEHMQNYYWVAVRAFTDNIITLGVECCLLEGLEDLLSGSFFASLSDEDVELISLESDEDRYLRQLTQDKLSKLKAGRTICLQHQRPRSTTLSEKGTMTAFPRTPNAKQVSTQMPSSGASGQSGTSSTFSSQSSNATTPGSYVAKPDISTASKLSSPQPFIFGTGC